MAKSTNGNDASPWLKSMHSLYSQMKVATKKSGYNQASFDVLQRFRTMHSLQVLHIKPEGRPDQISRLHMFLHAMNREPSKGATQAPGAMVVVDSKSMDHEGFEQITWATQRHFTCQPMHIFRGDDYRFNHVVVLRGLTDETALSSNVTRVQASLAKLETESLLCKGVIWHECTAISLLTHLTKDIESWHKSFDRLKLMAVAIANGLTIEDNDLATAPSLNDRGASMTFLSQMAAVRIPVVFVDAYMLGIYSNLTLEASSRSKYWHRSSALPRFNEIFAALLPTPVHQHLININMDDLAWHVLGFTAKYKHVPGNTVIDHVKEEPEIVQSSYTTHVLKSELNANAPLNFRLTALTSSLLDRTAKPEHLIALSCEIHPDKEKLRVTLPPTHGPLVFIVMAKSTTAVVDQLHTAWLNAVQAVASKDDIPFIDRTVAKSWLTLAGQLNRRVEELIAASYYTKLTEEEQNAVKWLFEALVKGSMSQLATRSLGITPYEWWK